MPMLDAYKHFTNSLVNLVNRVRAPAKRTINALAPRVARTEFMAGLRFAAGRPFLLGTLAEASCRLAGGRFLAVKPAVHFADIQEDDVDIYSLNTDWSLGDSSPPKHAAWHKIVYQNTAAGAVLICHPLHVFRLWRRAQKADFSQLAGARERISGYVISKEKNLLASVKENHLVLIPGQGLLAWADDILDIVSRVEVLDWLCALRLDGN